MTKPVDLNPPDARRAPGIVPGRRRLLVGSVAAGPILFSATTRSALALECRSPSEVFSGNLSQPGPATCTAGRPPEFWKANFPVWPAPIDSPRIEIRSGAWYYNTGTGAELLTDFFPANGQLPHARIWGPNCGLNTPTNAYDFGIAFAAIFGKAHTGDLHPVVPTMRGQMERQCGGTVTYNIDDRDVGLWEVLAYPTSVGGALGEFASIVAAAYLNSLAFQHYPVASGQIVHMWNEGVTDSYCPTSGCSASHAWSRDRITRYLISTWT